MLTKDIALLLVPGTSTDYLIRDSPTGKYREAYDKLHKEKNAVLGIEDGWFALDDERDVYEGKAAYLADFYIMDLRKQVG